MNNSILKIKIDEIGTFLERPNRFVAKVKLPNNEIVLAHIHDSGRIKELLFPGNKVSLRYIGKKENRKTEWDVISALSDDGEDILINSSFHRYITDSFFSKYDISIFGKIDSIKPEVKYGKSRLDYLIEKNGEKLFIETKGVSLSINKVATFPDAPSSRATKHLEELIEIKKNGFRAIVILIILRDSDYFSPNFETDPIFSKKFYEALNAGVEIYPLQFSLINGEIFYKNKKISIILPK